MVAELFTDPIHYQATDDGAWEAIEVGFEADASRAGGATSDRAPVAVSIGSAGDDAGFLSVAADELQVSLTDLAGLTAADATLQVADVAPHYEEAVADFDDLLPGVGLRVIASADGARSFLVLKGTEAPDAYSFVVDAPDVTLTEAPDGGIDFVGKEGELAARMPPPYAVDSSPSETLGGGQFTDAVTLDLSVVAGVSTVTVRVDPDWLAKATYPVYVDPSITINGTADSWDAFVSKQFPTTNFADYVRPDSPYYHEHWLGVDPTNANNENRVLMEFDVAQLGQVTVSSAELLVVPYHQYYNAPTATRTWINRVTANWGETTVTWNNEPGSTNIGYADLVEWDWGSFAVTSTVQGWINGSYPNYGFKLHENGNGATYWKRLISSEQGSNMPRLVVTYHVPSASPTAPTGSAWANDRLLDWSFSDASGHAQSHFDVQVDNNSNFSSPLSTSGQVASATTSWSIPGGVSLTDGTTYYWRVRAKDGTSWSAWSAGAAFRWDDAAPAFTSSVIDGEVSTVGADYYDLGDGTFTIAIRGSDANAGIELSYLRLYNASDEMRVFHDWTAASNHCSVFNASTLVDAVSCARTYNSGGSREVTFTVVGLDESTSFDVQYYFTDYVGNTVGYVDTGQNLIFDADAPTASIAAPVESATVGDVVTISGTAADASFTHYELHYGSGASPSSWTDIGTNPYTTSVTGGPLGSWDTTALSDGTYTVRLRVYDRARVATGFSEILRTVDVVNGIVTATIDAPATNEHLRGTETITGTASATAGFSNYTLHYGSGCSPSAWTDIGTNPYSTPVTADTLGSWETTGVADGTYTIRLVANRTGGASAADTACITLDNTLPTAAITAPAASGTVDGTVSVVGSAEDANFERYTLELGAGSSPSSWTDLGTNPRTSPVTADELGSWDTTMVADGTYTLRLRVYDEAGGTGEYGEVLVTVEVLNDPPASAQIDEPAEEDWVGGEEVVVTGTGTAGPNFETYTLEFGVGCAPSAWLDIGVNPRNTPVDDGELGVWDTTELDDGDHALRLVVTKVDDSTDTHVVCVQVDNTPPDAEFLSPDAFTLLDDEAFEVDWSESDTGSGVAGRVLKRQRAEQLFDGSCDGVDWHNQGVWRRTPAPATITAADGDCFRWEVIVTDEVGNTATVVAEPLLIDVTPPTVEFVTPVDGAVTNSGASTALVQWSAGDPGSGVSDFRLRQEIADPVAGGCTGVTWTEDDLIMDPDSPLQVRDLDPGHCLRWVAVIEDGAGNAIEDPSGALLLDQITLAWPPAHGAFFDDETLEVVTDVATPTQVEFFVDGDSIGSDASAPFAYAWESSAEADGEHEIELVASYSSGPNVTSNAVTVVVANDLAPRERVEADAAGGRVDIDERALLLVYAMGAPQVLDGRYQGPMDSTTGHATTGLELFRDWDSLDTATQTEIIDFLEQDDRGAVYATPGTDIAGDPHPDFSECGWRRQGQFAALRFCRHESEHFNIKYYLESENEDGVAEDDSDSNEIPDYIDDLVIALEDAWDRFDSLGYSVPQPGLIRVEIRQLGGPGGQVLPPGYVVEIIPDAEGDRHVYLARHELFHYFQYAYLDFGDLVSSGQEQRFWMEATAEWAAHQAQIVGSQQVGLNFYSNDIGEFLGRPKESLNWCECPVPGWPGTAGTRQYGAFIFAEFLQAHYNDQLVIRETWEEIATNVLSVEGIDQMAQARGDSLRELLTAFAVSAYRMNFGSPGARTQWIQQLETYGIAHPDQDTSSDALGGPRPARQRHSLTDGPPQGDVVTLSSGGLWFVEFDPVGNDLARLDLTVSRERDVIDATLLLLDRTAIGGGVEYPEPCGSPIPISFGADNRADVSVTLNDGCATHAVMVLVHGDAIDAPDAEVFWRGRSTTLQLSNDTVTLGINPEGHLVTQGGVSSSSPPPSPMPSPAPDSTTDVGIRYAPTAPPSGPPQPQIEGLAHGADTPPPGEDPENDCPCEGWGVADAISGTSGWATLAGDGVVGLELLAVAKTDDTFGSTVSMADVLVVTHEIEPVLATDYLYRVSVSISNVSDATVDVRYRRVMDWTVEPFVGEEFVTIGTLDGPMDEYSFSSDDGKASPDPLSGPSEISEAGFFSAIGPGDRGALIDLDLGELAPDTEAIFSLYFGAAPNEEDALNALDLVGAGVYALGQPSDEEGELDADGVTFIFAYREEQIEV